MAKGMLRPRRSWWQGREMGALVHAGSRGRPFAGPTGQPNVVKSQQERGASYKR